MNVTKRVLAIALVMLAAPGALAGCSSNPLIAPQASPPCVAKPSGALCIHLVASGATLEDVIGYVSASSWPLSDSPWRLVLNGYGCDPGTLTTPSCDPTGFFPGPERRGAPPLSITCRQGGSGSTVTAPFGCHNVLAQEMATHGDWAGFYRLSDGRGQRFASATWLCISEQELTSGSWVQAAPSTRPLRACSRIG